MDFRRVAKEYRICAAVVQACLLLSVAAFATQRAIAISSSSNSVALQVSSQRWSDLGEWAVCTSATGDAWMKAAGVGVFDTNDGEEMLEDPALMVPSNRSKDLAASRISRRALNVSGKLMNCSVTNLMTLPDVEMPGKFSICSDTPGGPIMVKSGGQWKIMNPAGRSTYYVLSVTAYRHGQHFGYSSQSDIFFHSVEKLRVYAPNWNLPSMCHWKQFINDSAPAPSLGNAVIIVISDPLIHVSLEKGILLQYFELLSSLGGYISVTVAVFGLIFVRKFPQSDVARVFEERTLRCNEAPGNPAKVENDLEEHAHLTMTTSSSSSPVLPARSAPESETVGLVRLDRQESSRMPPLPVPTCSPPGVQYAAHPPGLSRPPAVSASE
ncbi:unnamed protein product [Symbiodinium natans]|uniref:Uncharacterized protein n=1 Tax=Symbiodinium natans TaxID=878477 RepID=A0A812PMY4_9DINO|nr:unnamed protein product [Symbiodinium natans]